MRSRKRPPTVWSWVKSTRTPHLESFLQREGLFRALLSIEESSLQAKTPTFRPTGKLQPTQACKGSTMMKTMRIPGSPSYTALQCSTLMPNRRTLSASTSTGVTSLMRRHSARAVTVLSPSRKPLLKWSTLIITRSLSLSRI